MAAAKGLAITKLTEQILLDVPMRELLLAQRVNRHFHNTIQQPKPLQRALFLAPGKICDASIDSHSRHVPFSDAYIKPNPLLLKHHGITPKVVSIEIATVHGRLRDKLMPSHAARSTLTEGHGRILRISSKVVWLEDGGTQPRCRNDLRRGELEIESGRVGRVAGCLGGVAVAH